MKAPLIRQFGPNVSFKKENGEIREFTESMNVRLIQHFEKFPPRIGDVFYIDAPFKIIKVFYNFNHDRFEIWWFHDLGYAEADVELDS